MSILLLSSRLSQKRPKRRERIFSEHLLSSPESRLRRDLLIFTSTCVLCFGAIFLILIIRHITYHPTTSSSPPLQQEHFLDSFFACSRGYTFFPHCRHCYRVFNEESTIEEAISKCVMEDGVLASVSDVQENNFLAELYKKGSASENTSFWIGLYSGDEKWKWLDQSDTNFSNWAEGMPSTDYNFAVMDTSVGNQWKSVAGDRKRPFICEKKINF